MKLKRKVYKFENGGESPNNIAEAEILFLLVKSKLTPNEQLMLEKSKPFFMDLVIKGGVKPLHAFGIMGNVALESSFIPDAGRNYKGYLQNSPLIHKYVSEVYGTSHDAQINYILDGLGGRLKEYRDKSLVKLLLGRFNDFNNRMNSINNVEDAVAAWEKAYEKSGGLQMELRKKYGRLFYNNLANYLRYSASNAFKFKEGAKIKIKKSTQGSFTEYCGGKVTEDCILRGKHSSNPAVRKRATFAANARHFKHKLGGLIIQEFKLKESANARKWNHVKKGERGLIFDPSRGSRSVQIVTGGRRRGGGNCGKGTRKILGNLFTSDDPRHSYFLNNGVKYGKQFGNGYLLKAGFEKINVGKDYVPQEGDVMVFQNVKGGDIAGHVQVYSNGNWNSDFIQSSWLAGPAYRNAYANGTLKYDVYRLPVSKYQNGGVATTIGSLLGNGSKLGKFANSEKGQNLINGVVDLGSSILKNTNEIRRLNQLQKVNEKNRLLGILMAYSNGHNQARGILKPQFDLMNNSFATGESSQRPSSIVFSHYADLLGNNIALSDINDVNYDYALQAANIASLKANTWQNLKKSVSDFGQNKVNFGQNKVPKVKTPTAPKIDWSNGISNPKILW